MITPAQFRQDFPEFANVGTFPDSAVNLWLAVAGRLLPSLRWQDNLDLGTELFTAHHLVLSARDQAAAAVGGIPGEVKGPVASKAVDKVSVSYDTGSVSLTDAGFWNMTSYGIRFLTLGRYMGAGGIQLGYPGAPGDFYS